jgi:hypothetical protein
MSTINENNIINVDDNAILENTPMVVVEQNGRTLAIPIMGGAGGSVAQVQADWNQTDDTAVDFIKNKPEIPQKVSELSDASEYAKAADVPTTVAELSDATNYAKKTDIVQADWAQTKATAVDFIKNKPEVLSPPTSEVVSNNGEAVTVNIFANRRYTYQKPITSLTISHIDNSDLESELIFTTGESITVSFPDNLMFVGNRYCAPNNKYILNVKNNIAVLVQYE